jgi:hypothetical protein
MRTLPLTELDMSRRPGELPCARWSERSQSLLAACRSAAIDDSAVGLCFFFQLLLDRDFLCVCLRNLYIGPSVSVELPRKRSNPIHPRFGSGLPIQRLKRERRHRRAGSASS